MLAAFNHVYILIPLAVTAAADPTGVAAAFAEVAWHIFQALGTIVALLVAWRALRRDTAKDIVMAVLTNEEFAKRWEKLEESARAAAVTAAMTAAADRVQMLVNSRTFMLRELQEQINGHFVERLDSIEDQLRELPTRTAEATYVKIHSLINSRPDR